MGQTLFEFGPRHHHVDLPVSEVRLRRAEPRGKLFSCGLFDHPGAREREKGPRLGKDHVRKRSEARQHPARGGMGEY